MLQHLLDSKLLPNDHMFYLLIKIAVLYARSRLESTNDLVRDPKIFQFVETIAFYGQDSVLNLLRGPGHHGKASVDPKALELAIASSTHVIKNSCGYTTRCGIHKHLLRAFTELGKKLKLPALIINQFMSYR